MSEGNYKIYKFGDFRLDASRRLLLKGDGGAPVKLTSKAIDTLLYLVRHGGQILDKEQLMGAVWPDTIVEENNLSQKISELRRALGEKQGENRYIATVPGRGFSFVAEVEALTGNDAPRELPEEVPAEKRELTESVSPPARPGVGRRRSFVPFALAAALVVSLLCVAALFLLGRARTDGPSTSPVRIIAVLPFQPVVAGDRDEALELGMADSLIARLSGVRDVTVSHLNSVRGYAAPDRNPFAAGRELKVEAVLDGHIQRSGDRIRVTARLMRVGDEKQLWAGQFDEKFTNIFAVQDSISERVANSLALELSGEEKARLIKRHTNDPGAYELYLKGRYYWSKTTPTDLRRSIEFYRRAIEVDPGYALAYSGMADAYGTLAIAGDMAPRDVFPKAKAAAARAIEIDEALTEAHAALGTIKFWYDWDWDGAEVEFKRAIDLNPNYGEVRRMYAHLLSNTGRHDEAVAEARRAREQIPLSLITNALEGLFLHYAGRNEEAITRLHQTFEIDPNYWVGHINLAKVYINQRKFPEALAELKKAREFSGGHTETVSLLGYTLAVSGDRDGARAAIDELELAGKTRYVPPYNVAMIHNGLGEIDETFAWLDKAEGDRDVRLTFLKVDPKWDKLRSDPRFAALLRRMNFAP